jgi:membrane-bound lytic murein transglycosylase D
MPTISPQSTWRLALLVGSVLFAACSTAPANKSSHNAANQLTAYQPPKVTLPEVQLPPDWLSIESTVVSLGEQDLFDHMRYGFALNDASSAAIDREEAWYANHPDYLDRTFRRGERYLYYIVSELEARKMPLELALLPVVESAFIPTALSHAAASGLWQFIPSTGTRFGLKQNGYYDGRRDVAESTRAALDYLQFLAQEFNGDWYLAIAAYNCGEMNVSRAVERNRAKGLPIDFFSLNLPRETEAYVPKLLAMRRIIENPARYGLEFGSMENQPYFVKVDVGGQIDLAVAAELAGMPQEDFLAINPGFKRRVTDPSGPHQLLIPVGNEQLFLQKLASLPADKRVPVVYYHVRKGDTLSKIASRYGLSVAELRSLNGLQAKSVKPGQELILRGGKMTPALASSIAAADVEPPTSKAKSSGSANSKMHTVRRGETLWSIAQQYDIDAADLAGANRVKNNAIKVGQKLRLPSSATNSDTHNNAIRGGKATAATQELNYTVRNGDTLKRIATQFKVDVKQLINWNNLRSADAIRPGQRLMLVVDDSHRYGG